MQAFKPRHGGRYQTVPLISWPTASMQCEIGFSFSMHARACMKVAQARLGVIMHIDKFVLMLIERTGRLMRACLQ